MMISRIPGLRPDIPQKQKKTQHTSGELFQMYLDKHIRIIKEKEDGGDKGKV